MEVYDTTTIFARNTGDFDTQIAQALVGYQSDGLLCEIQFQTVADGFAALIVAREKTSSS